MLHSPLIIQDILVLLFGVVPWVFLLGNIFKLMERLKSGPFLVVAMSLIAYACTDLCFIFSLGVMHQILRRKSWKHIPSPLGKRERHI